MHDISTKMDIKIFVDQFYNEVKIDPIIGPIFSKRLGVATWDSHLERMSSFWNTVLFGVADYRGNPFSHHISLGIDSPHFDRWVELFEKTIHSNFKGPKAQEAVERAQKMRMMFETKLKAVKNKPNLKPIL